MSQIWKGDFKIKTPASFLAWLQYMRDHTSLLLKLIVLLLPPFLGSTSHSPAFASFTHHIRRAGNPITLGLRILNSVVVKERLGGIRRLPKNGWRPFWRTGDVAAAAHHTKSRHCPPLLPPHIVLSQVEMRYLGFRLIPSLAHIATSCCECCRGFTDLKSRVIVVFPVFSGPEEFGRW